MVFDRYKNGFDNCLPPVCREDIDINIENVTCSEDKILTVTWRVTDLYNRSPTANSILWSCDNSANLNNVSFPINTTQPYITTIDVSGCSGVVYLLVKVRIETSFFESELSIYDTDLCEVEGLVVRASLCPTCSEITDPEPTFLLYVKKSSIPATPTYFSYEGFCWTINNLDSEIDRDLVPGGSFVIDISTYHSSCSECCESFAVPASSSSSLSSSSSSLSSSSSSSLSSSSSSISSSSSSISSLSSSSSSSISSSSSSSDSSAGAPASIFFEITAYAECTACFEFNPGHFAKWFSYQDAKIKDTYTLPFQFGDTWGVSENIGPDHYFKSEFWAPDVGCGIEGSGGDNLTLNGIIISVEKSGSNVLVSLTYTDVGVDYDYIVEESILITSGYMNIDSTVIDLTCEYKDIGLDSITFEITGS